MPHAAIIWHNAAIQTLDPNLPRAQAIAATGGRIVAVGSDSDILNIAGPATRRYNLGGRHVLPGLVESHSHALWGACRDLFDVATGYRATVDQVLAAVGNRARDLPAGAVIFGGTWRLDMRGRMGPSPRSLLDTITTAHPVVLQDLTQHSVWCNSLALNLAGLGRDCADIAGGVIEREPDGAPNGILAENASAPARALSRRTPENLALAAKHFVKYFNAMGITAFKEPMAVEEDMATYKATDQAGALTLHMAAHLVRSSPMSAAATPWDTLDRWRRDYASENIRTGFAKLFLDGVAPSFTASFLDPYLAACGYDVAGHDPDATLLIPRDELNETVVELDRRGFVTKMHAVGDNAVRVGLDAIQAARAANGNSGLRHEIAHTAFVADADLGRFRALDAIAEMSPKLWFPNAATAAQLAVLGRARVEKLHRVRDLSQAGAEMTYGSDWPAAAPDANPWVGLAGMIGRRDPSGQFDGTIGADQAIGLEQALPIFTRNGARSLGMGDETGTLEAGKWADFVVLDADIGNLTPEEIGAIKPRATWWKGNCVYSAD